jgi:hypothetical protein
MYTMIRKYDIVPGSAEAFIQEVQKQCICHSVTFSHSPSLVTGPWRSSAVQPIRLLLSEPIKQ